MPIIVYKNQGCAPVDLHAYNIPAPSNPDTPSKTLYYVATSTLQRLRATHNKQGLLFISAVQRRLRTHLKYRFWLRSEESAFISRAAKNVHNGVYAQSIQKDWQRWHKFLTRLAETVPTEHTSVLETVVTKNLEAIGHELYEKWLSAIAKGQQEKRNNNPDMSPDATWYTFEQAFLNAMKRRSAPFFSGIDHVVMEGFTYLPPLHRHFLSVAQQHCTVHFILPMSKSQSRGFEAVDGILASILNDFPGVKIVDIPESSTTSPPLLQYAKTQLFVDEAESADFTGVIDSSVQVHTHINRQDEIQQVIAQIKELLEPSNGEEPVLCEQIAIVSRSSKEFEEALLLEAQYQGIAKYFNVYEPNVLLTPVGKLLLTLYGSVVEKETTTGVDGMEQRSFHHEVLLSVDDVQTIFRAGIFGDDLRKSLRAFNGIRAKFFEEVETKQEWLHALQRVECQIQTPSKKLTERDGRIPENFVLVENVHLWKNIISSVFDQMTILVDKEAVDMLEHVTQIQQLLSLTAETSNGPVIDTILHSVRGIFEQILEKKSDDEKTIPFTIPEVHQILVGFGNYSNIDLSAKLHAIDSEKSPDTEDDEAAYIPILGLEGLDNTTREYVFWLGVDDTHHPRFRDEWPFTQNNDKQLKLERYLFLSVVRSANTRLSLHWSKADQRKTFNPSIYLLELASICGIELTDHSLDNVVDDYSGSGSMKIRIPSVVDRKEYSLSELSIFAHCPRRWLLEEMEKENGAFEHEFHNRWMLTVEWLEPVLDHFANGKRQRWSVFKRKLRQKVLDDSPNFLSVGDSIKFVNHAILKLMFAMTRDIERIPVDWEGDTEPEVALVKEPNHVVDIYGLHNVDVECGYGLQIWNGDEVQTYPLTFPIVMRTWLSRSFGVERNEEVLTGMTQHIDWIHGANSSRNGGVGSMAFTAEVYDAIVELQDPEQLYPPKEPRDAGCHLCPVRTVCISMNGGE